MNKRIKKKRELIEQVQGTKEAVNIALNIIKSLLDENTKQANEISELRSIVERNALATNSRFDVLESKNKRLRIDLESAVIEFRRPRKKSWFGK